MHLRRSKWEGLLFLTFPNEASKSWKIKWTPRSFMETRCAPTILPIFLIAWKRVWRFLGSYPWPLAPWNYLAFKGWTLEVATSCKATLCHSQSPREECLHALEKSAPKGEVLLREGLLHLTCKKRFYVSIFWHPSVGWLVGFDTYHDFKLSHD